MLNRQHNVVSILYTIKGMVETHFGRLDDCLFRDKEEALDHAQGILHRIYSQADKALFITKRIGMAVKIAKTHGVNLEPVSIHEVWQEVLETIETRYPVVDCEIINHIPDRFPAVRCDRRDLVEIMYCLVENALQAMEAHGAKRKEQSVSADQENTDDMPYAPCAMPHKLIVRANLGFKAGEEPITHITVADTGPGIAEETLHYLFEPFMTTKAPEQGNGLGLCLVKSLVRKNGGSIAVSSFRGCGTTFALTFPVFKTADKATNGAASRTMGSSSRHCSFASRVKRNETAGKG